MAAADYDMGTQPVPETQTTFPGPQLDAEAAVEFDDASARFEVNCKNLFLTYPRLKDGFSLELLVKHLLEELTVDAVRGIYAVKELHEDGGEHAHVLIALKKRKHIRGSHAFDFEDQHCHIQRCEKGLAVAWKYLQKGYVHAVITDDYVEYKPGILFTCIYGSPA